MSRRALLNALFAWLIAFSAMSAAFFLRPSEIARAFGFWFMLFLPPAVSSILGTIVFVSFEPGKNRAPLRGAILATTTCLPAAVITSLLAYLTQYEQTGDISGFQYGLLLFVYAGLPAVIAASLGGAISGQLIQAIAQLRQRERV